MTDATYRVVFSGNILPGADRETAIANFARLLKRTPDQVAGAFSGKQSVLKKGLPEADATRYLQVLEKIGLQVRCEAEQAEPEKPALELSLAHPDSAPVRAAREEKPEVAPPKIRESLALVVDDDKHKEEAVAGQPSASSDMTCPACGNIQPKADICSACGVVIAKYIQRQPAKIAAVAADTGVADDQPETVESGLGATVRGMVRGVMKRFSGSNN